MIAFARRASHVRGIRSARRLSRPAPRGRGARRRQAPAAPPSDGAGVHVTIETFAIDRKGTWSVGSDESRSLPGTPGVLEKSVTLVGRDKKRTQDKVTIKARLTPDAGPPGEAACVLRVVFETRHGAGHPDDTPIDRRDALVTLAAGEERLLDVYASPLNAGSGRHAGALRPVGGRRRNRSPTW